MRVIFAVLALVFLSGCSVMRPYPYAEIGLSYKLEASSSVVLIEGCDYVTLSPTHSTRPYQTASCGGQQPVGHVNFGLEFGYADPSWWKPDRVAAEHWSHPFDGAGDSRRETHLDSVGIFWRVGGRPQVWQ